MAHNPSIHVPDDALNRDILNLLAVSSLTEREKKLWLETLPHMSADDRAELKKNLEEQVALDTDIAGDAVSDFARVLENSF